MGPRHIGVVAAQQFVGTILYPACHVDIGGPAVGRVVFEAAVLRRIVGRRDRDAIGQSILSPAIVNENRMRDHRYRRYAVVWLNNRFHTVCRQNFNGCALRGTGQRMRILAHVERAVDVMPSAVVANGLRNGEDVRLIECAEQRRAAMAARAEADQLARVGQIGFPLVIFTFKLATSTRILWGAGLPASGEIVM
jgi:hypothetical protein